MKRVTFCVLLLVLGSVFCYSQNVVGRWEQRFETGRIILNFNNESLGVEVILNNGQSTYVGLIPYFISNNILMFLNDTGGTGIYAERTKFEVHRNGNTLVLIALNPNAMVARIEGRYTRIN